jgi:hypothetical protein
MTYERMLWSNVTVVVPWVAVGVVLTLTGLVDRTIDLGSLLFDGSAAISWGMDLPAVSRHLVARVAWAIPALGFALIALAALSASALVLIRCLRSLQRRERVVAGAAIVLFALAYWSIGQYGGALILSEPGITSQLRKMTMHRTSATHAVSVDTFFDTVSYVIFLLLVSAASMTVVRSTAAERNAQVLKDRLDQLRWLLYVGATALMLRAVEMYALYRWPGVWLSPEAGRTVDRMALAVSIAHGAVFSAILLALYLPTALTLRLRSTWLATQATAGTTESPGTWLAKMGLELSPLQEVARLVVTVAPLLAGGSVAKLIDVFVS